MEESPYIGKGRFKKNSIAREGRLPGAQQAKAGVMGQGQGSSVDSATQQQLNTKLDGELEEKRRAISLGKEPTVMLPPQSA